MKRKIIAQKDSFTITLPKKWADIRGLKSGESINLEEIGDQLLLTSEVITKKSTSINFEDHDYAWSKHALTHLYRLGYDKITILSQNINILKKIEKEVVHLLLGFEILDKTTTKLVIENISEPSEDKFDVILRRGFLIIKDMALASLNHFEKGDYENLKEKKDQLDKLMFFCKRSLTKKINSFNKPLIYWEQITYLLAIGHGYYYLNEYLKKTKKPSKELIEYFSDIIDSFDLLYQGMYKKDIKFVSKIKNLKDSLVFNRPELMLEKNKDNSAVIAKLMYQARIIQLTAGSVFYLMHDED